MRCITATAFCVTVLALVVGDTSAGFSYPNFSDTTGLTLNRDAHVITPPGSGTQVRLVSAGAIYGGGSVYYNQPQSLSSFQSSFCFRIGDLAPGAAPEIDSGIYWWANITYQADILTVVMGQPPFNWIEVLSVPVDIPAILGQDSAYVGFTGGTGLAHANHDICSWSFVPEPTTIALLALGLLACTRKVRPKKHRPAPNHRPKHQSTRTPRHPRKT